VPEENLLVRGYSLGNITLTLEDAFGNCEIHLPGIFVNSTISLEGVVGWLAQRGLTNKKQPPLGCFYWDPFVSLLGHNISMIRQDVPAMLDAVFKIIDTGEVSSGTIETPPLLIKK